MLAAAVALAPERVCYAWIARAPGSFRAWCARKRVARLGEPVLVVRRLFYGFKVVQLSVFAGWWLAQVDSRPLLSSDDIAVAVGIALIVTGQGLNALVFYRLGATGVFYGSRLGYTVAWCREFPFSVMSHPQYVGTVLSIWGLFLTVCFPQDDWFVVPTLETTYYLIGARLEETDHDDGPDEHDRLVDRNRFRASTAATS